MWYFTDVHGDKQLFNYVMDHIGNDPFIFGGDACDRGEHGYEIIKSLINNPRCNYIKGNHEDLFVKAARALRVLIDTVDAWDPESAIMNIMDIMDVSDNEDIKLHLYNGGLSTLRDWYCDRMPMDILDQIDKLEINMSWNQYDFCHAGAYQHMWNKDKWDEQDIKTLIWNRHHFNFAWFDDRILIHGHTPVNSMPSKWRTDYAPILYCGGTKLAMDGGTAYNHQIFLLNLDHWEFYRYTYDTVHSIVPMDRTKKIYYDKDWNLITPEAEIE